MKSTFAFVGAFVLCPCHFPITLALLPTTGFGAFLTGYTTALYVVSGIAFLFLFVLGVRYFRREREEVRAKEHRHAVGATCQACPR
jgi:membrane protein implicated in regulation of membrane protease activity